MTFELDEEELRAVQHGLYLLRLQLERYPSGGGAFGSVDAQRLQRRLDDDGARSGIPQLWRDPDRRVAEIAV